MFTTIKISSDLLKKFYRPIVKEAHKGTQGHALLIGGSYGKIGSVCLASVAALRSGCGLVTAYIPKCGYEVVQISIPEVMVITNNNAKIITTIQYTIEPNAIGIGMGMGQEAATEKAFYNFLTENKLPLVIDADALNILSKNKNWITLLAQQSILTPHQKELERIIGGWQNDEEKFEKVIRFSKDNDIIIVVKGAPTLVVYKDTIYQNATGNQALATAGSGDVLTGIITGLVAQNYNPLHAALLGVYLHGLTADLALPETGYASFIASDINRYLAKAFLSLEN